MKNILYFIFTSYLISVCFGQEEMQCRGVDLDMNDKQKAQITDCLKEAGIRSVWRIPAEKLACFGVCVLEKKEMLTEEGKINHQKVLDYIEKVMKPDDIKKPLRDGVDLCIKEHGEKVRTKNDPGCMTYMETGQCVHDVFLDICVEG